MTKTQAIERIKILQALIDLADISKITNTFLKAFMENSHYSVGLGTYILFGNFNLGGTVSGRLSSSKPNLQNIPSNSKYAKAIKECFSAPDGWVFGGADFNSLEDYVSALTTKDPNKLKVYIEGFDGHCLRAVSYFGDQMPDIDPTNVESVNSVADLYPKLRQDSKGPTFALTYQGTAYTLMKNLGWSKDKAEMVEAKYHELYSVSDAWVQDKLKQASHDGYVTVAFGLRVRTPLIHKAVWGSSQTPKEALAEGRTAGNALGQSYGLLNSRAASELRRRLKDSPYRHDIRPACHIHDAQYFWIKAEPEVIEWLNTNLVECMQWQELEELKHPEVHLGGALDIFYPNWATPTTLPNGASVEEIIDLFS